MLQKTSNQGFTMLEVMISTTILAILTVAGLQILQASQQLHAHSFVQDSLRADAERVIHRIIQEFEDITRDSIISDDQLSSASPPAVKAPDEEFQAPRFLRFKKIRDVIPPDIRVFSPEEFAFSLDDEDDDPEDGVDNNNNGIIDEKKLVFIRYADATVPNNERLDPNKVIVTVLARNLTTTFDSDDDGPLPVENVELFSCTKNDIASIWKIEIKVAMQKKDLTGQRISTGLKATKIRYKTTTIALQ